MPLIAGLFMARQRYIMPLGLGFRRPSIGRKTAMAHEATDEEASVRMQYVNVELALNSDAKGDEEEKKVFDTYKDSIANIADFFDSKMIWLVMT